jgi:hypothetical protein
VVGNGGVVSFGFENFRLTATHELFTEKTGFFADSLETPV